MKLDKPLIFAVRFVNDEDCVSMMFSDGVRSVY